jgi:hypothetical protein
MSPMWMRRWYVEWVAADSECPSAQRRASRLPAATRRVVIHGAPVRVPPASRVASSITKSGQPPSSREMSSVTLRSRSGHESTPSMSPALAPVTTFSQNRKSPKHRNTRASRMRRAPEAAERRWMRGAQAQFRRERGSRRAHRLGNGRARATDRGDVGRGGDAHGAVVQAVGCHHGQSIGGEVQMPRPKLQLIRCLA